MAEARQQISNFIAQKALDGGLSKKVTKEIAAYLLSSSRANEVNSIMRDVQNIWAQNGYVEIIARSSHELSSTTKNDIIKQLKPFFGNPKRIVVTQVLDENIVGGVSLELADNLLDLSLRKKLNKFKRLVLA